MTTFDVEIGKNINEVYLKKLRHRAHSALPSGRYAHKKIDQPDTKPVKRSSYKKENIPNGQIQRSETVPNLRPQAAIPVKEGNYLSFLLK